MKKVVSYCLIMFLTLNFLTVLQGCVSSSGSSGSSTDTSTDTADDPSSENIDIIINKIETDCSSGNITVYVSVIDADGEIIDQLDMDNFQIKINDTTVDEVNFEYVQVTTHSPVSVAILMDYSTSITNNPDIQSDMEGAVVNFINLMENEDEGAIFKFNIGIEYSGEFTNDKNSLIDAVNNVAASGNLTWLYHSLYTAVAKTAAHESDNRKAVVAITDGVNSYSEDDPPEYNDSSDVIDLAQDNQIPLFLIGLGDEPNQAVLQNMASETDGHFYPAADSSELEDIYAGISELLSQGRYKMVLQATSFSQTTGSITILATYNGETESVSATFSYAVCP